MFKKLNSLYLIWDFIITYIVVESLGLILDLDNNYPNLKKECDIFSITSEDDDSEDSNDIDRSQYTYTDYIDILSDVDSYNSDNLEF